jgi:hypothetical protein
MSSQSIFCILQRISDEYKLPYADLLKLSNLSNKSPKKEKNTKVVMQAVMLNDICYYYDEMANEVYDKNDKFVGVICQLTYELIPT